MAINSQPLRKLSLQNQGTGGNLEKKTNTISRLEKIDTSKRRRTVSDSPWSVCRSGWRVRPAARPSARPSASAPGQSRPATCSPWASGHPCTFAPAGTWCTTLSWPPCPTSWGEVYWWHPAVRKKLEFFPHWTLQSTLSYVVGHVNQFQLSQSCGRDRLLESARFDSAPVGTGYFFRWLFSFEMQNNSSQPKNKKSTARKTRSTLVEKMAVLDGIYAGVSRCVFVLTAVSWSINQSIDQTVINWKCCENLLWKFDQQCLFGENSVLTLSTLKGLFQNLCVKNKREEIIDWRGALCSDSWQLCCRMRRWDGNQVTWPTTYGSVDCITHTQAALEDRLIKQSMRV